MKKPLKKIKGQLYYMVGGIRYDGPTPDMTGDCSNLRGDWSNLRGDWSNLRGDCSGLEGGLKGVPASSRPCDISDYAE